MFEPLTLAIAVAVLVIVTPFVLKLYRRRRHQRFIKANAYAYVAARRQPGWDSKKRDCHRRSGTHERLCRYRRRPVVNQGVCVCSDMTYWEMTFARAIEHDLGVITEHYSAEDLKAFKEHYQDALVLDAVRNRTLSSIEKFTADLEKEEIQHAKNIENLRSSNPDPELAEFNRLLEEA